MNTTQEQGDLERASELAIDSLGKTKDSKGKSYYAKFPDTMEELEDLIIRLSIKALSQTRNDTRQQTLDEVMEVVPKHKTLVTTANNVEFETDFDKGWNAAHQAIKDRFGRG